MKNIKLLLIAALCTSGYVKAQEITLPEITVVARNYKYLRSVDNKEAAQPVKLLERKAAGFDVKNSEFYEEDYANYYITFFLPEGYILATYDQDGRLLQTAEKFKNITLPPAVKNAVVKRYPNWSISKDIFLVKYENTTGANKVYKMILKNGKKQLRVKTDDKGEFLE